MNLNIVTGRLVDTDMTNIKFHSYGGRQPEAMAMAMLLCGPAGDPAQCFADNVGWIPGFTQGEGRLAFKRGELNVTRENPAAFKKHIQPTVDSGQAEVWFTHGILQADGSHTCSCAWLLRHYHCNICKSRCSKCDCRDRAN